MRAMTTAEVPKVLTPPGILLVMRSAMDRVTAPDVLATYAHLRVASLHHLVAFGG
jgi:hypothetical protein